MSGLPQTLVAKLESSGLHPDAAATLGLTYLTKSECAAYFPRFEMTQAPEEGFVLPYFDVHGTKTPFFRYRYLTLPSVGGFGAATGEKPPKYVQPPGTLSDIYLPPMR